jgi:hypothetical protein
MTKCAAALGMVAAAALLITSQAHATAPVVKNIGCPPDVPCANGQGSHGGGSGGGGPAKPPAAPAAPAVPAPPSGPKINSISLGSNKIVDGQMLDVSVAGEGKACNYYLTVTNTDNNDEWPLPKTSAFPATDKYALNLNDAQYPHGAYKITAKARSNDVRPGIACLGSATSTPFTKARLKMTVDLPQIVGVLLEPGQKMGGTDRYRTDETIKFNVVGSVENTDPKDEAKRCGWTIELVDSNQVAKVIGTNSQFGVWQNSAPLTGLAQGAYTLTVKTTGADDGKAKQPCLGKASKKVDVFAVPGMIKDVKVMTYNSTFNPPARQGRTVITPVIAGETCIYKVTRFVAGAGNVVTMHTHTKGQSDEIQQQDQYPNDKTTVDITVAGTGTPGSCEGSAHKTVIVYDHGESITY